MTNTETDRLAEIRARAAAATPGPWRWHGNTDNRHVWLQTPRMGGMTVMDFVRWGMQQAAPRFGVDGLMRTADTMVRYAVAPDATSRKDPSVYRADITSIRHPDAEFIAASRADVDWLLAEVERLRDENSKNLRAVGVALAQVGHERDEARGQLRRMARRSSSLRRARNQWRGRANQVQTERFQDTVQAIAAASALRAENRRVKAERDELAAAAALPADAEAQLRTAVGDPGSRLPRLHGTPESGPETVTRWTARAVLDLLRSWQPAPVQKSAERVEA